MQYSEGFEKFWRYATAIHKRTSDRKAECFKEYQKHEKEWLKDNEGEFADYLIRMIDIEQRHRATMHQAGKKVDARQAWVRWLKNYSYMEEFEESIGELQREAKGLNECAKCGASDRLYYRAGVGYLCPEDDQEYDQEKINELRHIWKKVTEKFPRKDGESYREHHRRYVDQLRKDRSLPSLPYRKTERVEEEYTNEQLDEMQADLERREFKGVDEETLKRYYGGQI